MPYKDPEKRKAMNRERMRKKREDPAYLEKEAKVKAKQYQEHKAEYRRRLQEYRAKIREQSIMSFNPKEDE